MPNRFVSFVGAILKAEDHWLSAIYSTLQLPFVNRKGWSSILRAEIGEKFTTLTLFCYTEFPDVPLPTLVVAL